MRFFHLVVLAIFAEIIFYNPLSEETELKAEMETILEMESDNAEYLEYNIKMGLLQKAKAEKFLEKYTINNDAYNSTELFLYKDYTFELKSISKNSTLGSIDSGTWQKIGNQLKLKVQQLNMLSCASFTAFPIDKKSISIIQVLEPRVEKLFKSESEYIFLKENQTQLKKIKTLESFFISEHDIADLKDKNIFDVLDYKYSYVFDDKSAF